MPKIDKYGLPDDTPDSWVEAVGKGTLAGYGFGTIVGTMHASWSDVPVALREQSWPGLQRTVQIMNQWGLTFATVGASYAAAKVVVHCGLCDWHHHVAPTQATAQAIRGTSDWKNGAIGGFAAGAAVGLRSTLGSVAENVVTNLCHSQRRAEKLRCNWRSAGNGLCIGGLDRRPHAECVLVTNVINKHTFLFTHSRRLLW